MVPAWGWEIDANFVHSLRAHLGPDGRQTHRACSPGLGLHDAPGPAGILLPVWPLGGAKAFSLTPCSAAPWRNFAVFLSPLYAYPRPPGIPPSLVGILLPVWGSAPQNENFFDRPVTRMMNYSSSQISSIDPRGAPLPCAKMGDTHMSRMCG